MTVLVLLFLVLHAIPAAASLLFLPASSGYLANAAYVDNISSFFSHNSRYPSIRIAGWNKPRRTFTNRHGKALSTIGTTEVKIA